MITFQFVLSIVSKILNQALADDYENDIIPIKPIKKTIGTIIKKEMINADFKFDNL